MVDMHWQVQEAKQGFSELLRRARRDGRQIVTKHGQPVAVVLDIEEYRRLTGGERDFKQFLRSQPPSDELVLTRDDTLLRDVDLETS